MATFAITVDVSPLATALELYYTHVLPDGTISSPSQKYTGVGVNGFIALPATPHPPGYNYTINNVILNDNTVYNFEVKQFCVDGTVEYSPIDGDHYRTNCVDLLLNVGGFNYNDSEYPIVATWAPAAGNFDPNNYSIQDYTLHVKYVIAGIGTPGNPSGQTTVIDTINIGAVPATIPGGGYVYYITSNDLSYNLAYGEIYNVAISFNIVLSTGSLIEVTCPYKPVQLPYLRTYKVHGAEGWVVDWIDENNNHQRACGGADNAPNGPTRPCEAPWVLVHHRTNPGAQGSSNPLYPVCGYCVTPGVIFPVQYNFMYIANPTVYNSDRINCYPVTAGTKPNPSIAPCDCGDVVTNSIKPSWGASWELIGTGYVPISGVIPPTPCAINTVCIGAPNW